MLEALLVCAVVALLLVGALAAWLWGESSRWRAAAQAANVEAERTRTELAAERAEADRLRDEAGRVHAVRAELDARLAAAQEIAQRESAAAAAALAKVEQFAKTQVEATRQEMKAIAGDVLRAAAEDIHKRTAQQNAASTAAVEGLVKPIQEALTRTSTRLEGLERERAEQFGKLHGELRTMQESERQLRLETSRLVGALKAPKVRGQYGEVQLQRVVELAGMRSYCDFATQESVRDEHGKLKRPDLVVKLPNDREIAIDAKTNIGAYLEAMEAGSQDAAEERLVKFADDVRNQVQQLARKQYWSQYEHSPEFVVMFVPGDQFVDAALARRPDLLDHAAQQGVILASPSTLIGLLRAVQLGWRQRVFDEQAREIMKDIRELNKRVGVVWRHLGELGDAVEKTADRYNAVVKSIESRMLPQLRRFEQAEIGEHPLPQLSTVEVIVKPAKEIAGLFPSGEH